MSTESHGSAGRPQNDQQRFYGSLRQRNERRADRRLKLERERRGQIQRVIRAAAQARFRRGG